MKKAPFIEEAWISGAPSYPNLDRAAETCLLRWDRATKKLTVTFGEKFLDNPDLSTLVIGDSGKTITKREAIGEWISKRVTEILHLGDLQ